MSPASPLSVEPWPVVENPRCCSMGVASPACPTPCRPQAPTHILIIPTKHIESVAVVGDDHGDLVVELLQTAAHLAEANGIAERGWRLVTNVGPEAGQSVAHLHFHLLGGRPMRWPPG